MLMRQSTDYGDFHVFYVKVVLGPCARDLTCKSGHHFHAPLIFGMQRQSWLLEEFHHFSREEGTRILRPTLVC